MSEVRTLNGTSEHIFLRKLKDAAYSTEEALKSIASTHITSGNQILPNTVD
jgi:hypothetical protein